MGAQQSGARCEAAAAPLAPDEAPPSAAAVAAAPSSALPNPGKFDQMGGEAMSESRRLPLLSCLYALPCPARRGC